MMLKYFKFFSWNIEGWNRNCFNLMNLVDSSSPSLIFLPEPQLVIYLHFSLCLMVNFGFTLTARILSVLRFPWRQERTMAIWEGKLDPNIRILPPSTSAVLPLLLSPPGLMPTAHITAEANISPKVNISARTPIMAME